MAVSFRYAPCSSSASPFRPLLACCCRSPANSSLRRSFKVRISRKAFPVPLNAAMEASVPAKHDLYTVDDFMTRKDELIVAKATTTVDEALELLVHNRITGLPVVDENWKVIGVVSDFDLLALDTISGSRPTSSSLFPEPGSTWKAFKEIQKLISKTHGKTVEEVMTPSPLVVRQGSNFDNAARLLLETQKRRVPVVDDKGKLVGVLTRGNLIKAALRLRQNLDISDEQEDANPSVP